MSAQSNYADRFAALGDTTRLSLVTKLSQGQPYSITQLTQDVTQDVPLTRQAVTKHLKHLEGAGLVRSVKRGRETLFEYNPEAIDGMKDYLERISQHWDKALSRLKAFVESDTTPPRD